MDFLQIATKLRQKSVSPKDLLLDHQNPRFKGEKDYIVTENADPSNPTVQGKILEFFKKNKKYDIRELKNSIVKVGFLKMDRIVVRKIADDQYVVLEGNRRIAAVKWILQEVDDRGLQLERQVASSIDKLDVLELVGSELSDDEIKKATWFLQGVRHISGIKPWGPYQQAELITQFKTTGRSFTEAGQAVGVGPRKAGQMMRAYNGLSQMQEDAEFHDVATPDLFSHFQQAIIKTSVRDWLNYDEEDGVFKNKNALKLFYKLITPDPENDNKVELIAKDVRDRLPAIVESESALSYLNKGHDVDFCYSIAMAQSVSAPTWHAAAKEAIKKLGNIPWTYDFIEEDKKILSELNSLTERLIKNIG